MAEALKYMYNPAFFNRLCPIIKDTIPGFDDCKFIHTIFDEHWPDLELKQRVRHITLALHKFLPENFSQACPLLIKLCHALREKEEREQGFGLIFLADYLEVYGLAYFNDAMKAMEEVTILVSAEFAIRPFLLRYPEQTFQQLLRWSKHPHAHVRRLASEGCRPRLPWAMGVPSLKKDPSAILAVLENLKADPSEYVRRSVANNLNDISKDHPELVLSLAKKWQGQSVHTDWIIKHACRTLLKKGHKKALELHGFKPLHKGQVKNLTLQTKKVRVGDTLGFTFTFQHSEKRPARFRLEYAVDYITSTGKISRKIFKIGENIFPPREPVTISRKQSFRDFTTRKHFKGNHSISILVNGNKAAYQEFIVC